MSKKLFSRKETREIAIAFAKWLMTMEMTKTNQFGIVGTPVLYSPIEFELMHGELNVHGKRMFDSFVESFEE